ncbi:uroporphyrinogen III synthase [Pseudoduganella sp. FT25W]|uniref:Uroporphyrinogen-III synthase n=1 Tax=Duganella alba TaxID=2666081 RepID=A0A6L5QH75_9BURK|nr:uroporphyrinogen-III synthase [Duganella alba]MRX08868.1 uroporphyrinogen III synthase [Duganella alba]MRX18838.1 uroporphyrinogen III synthase [Duganella alba]
MAGAVVITRPLAQATPLAARVAALGRTVEILPLLEIAPLADPAPLLAALAQLDQYVLVAFVSPNAIDAAFAYIKQWPAGVTLAVVGEGSRAALAAHGVTPERHTIVSPADSAHSDSEHLLQTLDLDALNGRRVLIIRGESGRELMGDGFRAAGALVDIVPAYCRSVPALTPQLAATLRRLLAQQNDWIITSSEALRGLCGLLANLDLQHPDAMQHNSVVAMQQQHLIVPHARIAETANNLGFSKLTLTGSGDERLLAALQSCL